MAAFDAVQPRRSAGVGEDDDGSVAGSLRIEVLGDAGALRGAKITATQEEEEDSRLVWRVNIASPIEGPDGVSLNVPQGGITVEFPRQRGADPEVLRATTEAEGVAHVAILDGRRWRVRVEAEAYAPLEWIIRRSEPLAECTVRLEPSCLVEVDRGAIPLESNVVVLLNSPFESSPMNGVIAAGQQMIRIPGLVPGEYRLEALSARGTEVAQWYPPLRVERDRIARVDLSGGGDARIEVDVRGASPSAPAHFVHVHGPNVEAGKPAWERVAPVHAGLANLRGLPAGPAVVRVLSGESEIGRAPFDAAPTARIQRVVVTVEAGALRALHQGESGDQWTWHLARRSSDFGAEDGWLTLDGLLQGQGESWYRGLAPGDYRFWAGGSNSVRRLDFTLDDATLEVELGSADGLSPLRIERGAGVRDGAPVEFEVPPGRWLAMGPAAGTVRLAHGAYRMRVALEDTGYAIRDIQVPDDRSVVFEEGSPPRELTVSCLSVEAPLQLRILTEELRGDGRRERSVPLFLDADGDGEVRLRPGLYQVEDRWGRTAPLVVGERDRSARIVFR